jgi:hypothetical protein
MRSLLLSALLGIAFVVTGCESPQTNVVRSDEVRVAQPGKVLRHVVLFKFKDEATPEQVNTVVDAFRALPGKIDGIKDFEWGTNVSPESHSQGLTHAFFLTFTSDADRDAYLVHPAHKEFGQGLRGLLDKVTVVDYWAQE